jgi:hypothetical protein
MNIFDLLESPGMGRPRDTKGVQSAADQSAASVIGSGTTEREAKKKPVTMMGQNVKEAVEEAAVKPNFKMPPESLQDKMYRQHQELRKQRGAPSPEEYKQRIAQKQKEIDDLKEGILDRAAPKMPKPRNPANAVLGNKVNAGGRHLDKKRRQELAPKHKHQDPLAESLRPGERHHFETDPVTGKRVYKGIRGDQQDAPQRAKDDPAARADQERRAHIAHDRGLTEQAVKITDYDLWSDEVKALGGEIHPQKDRNLLVAQSWDGEEIGKFHLGKSMGFINQQSVEEDISRRGFLRGLGAAALAGAAAFSGDDADAQNIDLPGPQVSYIAHIQAEFNGREISKTVNLGPQYESKEQAEQDLEEYMQSKGITRYNIRVEQSYDQPSGYGQRRRTTGYATGGHTATGPIRAPGIGDMVAGKVSREIRAGIPSKGGYATGGTNQGQRPRDGSQWWRDQLPQIMKEDVLEEDIESHLYLMSRAGYDIVQEEWSDKYKDSINCSNPKGFSQKAHCAGKKKNEAVAEEKVRLDPKCWSGKKIGNPKTKMKGGVRVNNCVPK